MSSVDAKDIEKKRGENSPGPTDSIRTGDELVEFFKGILKPLGYRRHRRAWYLDAPETVVIVDLQRSSWSESDTLNLGALVKAIDDGERAYGGPRPNIVDCHIRYLLDELFPEPPKRPARITPERARVHSLLDIEFTGTTIDPRQRATELRRIVVERLLPFLELCKTEAGIRKIVFDVLGFWNMGRWQLRERLDIPEELSSTTRVRRRRTRE